MNSTLSTASKRNEVSWRPYGVLRPSGGEKCRLDNLGDTRAVAGGLIEIRVHHGPGYRLYCLRDGESVVVLCGGDKDSQRRDIERAGRLARDWRRT